MKSLLKETIYLQTIKILEMKKFYPKILVIAETQLIISVVLITAVV